MLRIVTDHPDSPEMKRYLHALQVNGIPYKVVPFTHLGEGEILGIKPHMIVLDELGDIGHHEGSNL